MKKILPLMLIFGLFEMGCGNTQKQERKAVNIDKKEVEEVKEIKNEPGKQEKEVVVISTFYGDMVVELFESTAPMHVESFKTHAKNGYYDGTIFHRVIPGFMIQAGDPNTKGDNKATYGTGGHAAKYYGFGDESETKSWNLPAEFSKISHKRGILSMARSTSPNSGGSQFFICAADAPHLDGQYTVFGQVVEGDNVIEQIVNLPRDSRDNPNKRVELKVRLEKRSE